MDPREERWEAKRRAVLEAGSAAEISGIRVSRPVGHRAYSAGGTSAGPVTHRALAYYFSNSTAATASGITTPQCLELLSKESNGTGL
jgi:hypothetical protein